MNAFYPSLFEITKVLGKKGYVLFSNNAGFDLNIVGIRTAQSLPDSYDDYICVFYKLNDDWSFHVMNATTDAGLFYLKNPMNQKGTAILKPAQYRGAFRLGKHRGYKALVQNRPLTVFRDNNKDDKLDFINEETGMFGINIHRSSKYATSKTVGPYSAGCQVLSSPVEYNSFIKLCEAGAAKFGNSFTYTLIEEGDFKDGF